MVLTGAIGEVLVWSVYVIPTSLRYSNEGGFSMKEIVLFLLRQIDQEAGIIDSITIDPVIEESLRSISHSIKMIEEAMG